jgi:hypothetical protein
MSYTLSLMPMRSLSPLRVIVNLGRHSILWLMDVHSQQRQ